MFCCVMISLVDQLKKMICCGSMTHSIVAYMMLMMLVVAAAGGKDAGETDYETLMSGACIVRPKHIILTMNCPSGHMVRLLRIFLGNSTRGTCEYSPEDCTMDLPGTENYPCIGTQSCQIVIPSVNLGRQIPRCKEPSTYIQALYQCIPGSDSVNVCDRTRSFIVSQRGFVRTPGYPSNYPDNMNCSLTLVAPHDDQRLKLFVVDLNLEPNGSACSDWLQVFDGFQSSTLCGQRTRYSLRDSTQKTVNIQFSSDGSRQEKGFWIYYEAFPFMPTAPATPPAPSTASSTSPTSTAPLQQPMEPNSYRTAEHLVPADASAFSFSSPSYSEASSGANQLVYLASDSEASSMPLGVLLAVVITLLICILLILLIIVFIKSRSPRRHLSTETRLPESDDRMDNLEREQQRSFRPSSPLSSCSASFRDSAAGDRMIYPQDDALLSAYSPSKRKDIL